MKKINGSQAEITNLKNSGTSSISIVWGERFDSHAFMLEQILSKLEESKYAPREEIIEEWKNILEDK